MALVASYAALVALVAGQVMARSRAGLALAIIALLGALALALPDRRKGTGLTPARILGATVLLVVMFATQFALYRVMERFSADPLHDARIVFGLTTIEAARDFMPFGSGMGTFVPVYALYEKPHDLIANVFANRAHNDFLEVWLEAGVAGLALMAVFAVWFVMRCFALWRRVPVGLRPIDGALARAATLVVGLLVAHSSVDYPLRTSAMMAVFAFACALMIAPPEAVRRAEERDDEAMQSARRAAAGALPAASPCTRMRPAPGAPVPVAGTLPSPAPPQPCPAPAVGRATSNGPRRGAPSRSRAGRGQDGT